MMVRKVIAGLLEKGVREFVVCAGARNAALVEALAGLAGRGTVRLWRHFEERGAGFFALGRTMASGQPCAVVTTSGTAVAELLPAVIEARYQARPLVMVSADRPAGFRGSGAPQAIEQAGIFGRYVEGCDDLTGQSAFCLLESWSGRGPWQVNVCLEEDARAGEFEGLVAGEFVASRLRLDLAGLARFLREHPFRGLVLMIGGLEEAEREEAFHFANALDAPVVVEATSGLREALQHLALPDPDRMLRAKPPGKVLRLGDVPSGRCWRDLEGLPDTVVWSVTRSGFPGLARSSMVTRGEVHRVLAGLGQIEPVGDVLDHLRDAGRRRQQIEDLLEALPASEPAMLRTVSAYASLCNSVYLGNSLPIREWNLFAQWQQPVTRVRANRGANGIDGQTSTWLGATAGETDAWAVVGDLTALYDLAAPAMMEQVKRDGRVLCVLNNCGGRIFDRLPRMRRMSGHTRELMLNPHTANFDGWAAMWGLGYLAVRTDDDFDALDAAPRPLVLELLPNPEQTAAFWAEWDEMA